MLLMVMQAFQMFYKEGYIECMFVRNTECEDSLVQLQLHSVLIN